MHPDRLIDTFLKDVRYCSQTCVDEVVIPKPVPVYRPPPEPIHLVSSEQSLLTGKSSGGMYFDTGRCANCGQAIPHSSHIQFQFCDEECRSKAIRPYLPKDFEKETLEEDHRYSTLSEGLDEVCAMTEDDYLSEALDTFSGKSRSESIDLLRNKVAEAEGKFWQRRIDEEHAALTKFVKNWEAQRDFLLTRETTKLTEKLQTLAQKEDEKRLSEAAEREAFLEMTQPRPVPEASRAEHTHILGPSGSGKTTLLQKLILEDLSKDNPPGMVIIDPKGLMTERLQSLNVFNPGTGRLKDRLIIIDPTHNPPPALNMFHAASAWNRMWSEDQRRRIENQAISTFAFIFSSTGSKLTDKQSVPFSYAVRLMFNMESTIHTLVDLMDDPTRTDDIKGQKYSECRFAPFIGRLDAVSQRFFQNDFFSSNYKETRQQIKARIYGVLQHPEFVRMFEARERKLDILDCLQNRSIVLVNTGMNTMGSDASQLLGRYIIALTLNAAFARFTLPKDQWHQAHLFIDEFQEFADDEKTPELLRLAREYKLAVTLAHQEMHGAGMTDKIRSAISTNTTVKYSSRPEGADINYVARDMRCDPDFLTKMTKTTTEARFACFVRGMTEHPFAISLPFGAIEREPQMSAEAHLKLLDANAVRLSSKELAKRIVKSQPVAPSSASDAPESGSTW